MHLYVYYAYIWFKCVFSMCFSLSLWYQNLVKTVLDRSWEPLRWTWRNSCSEKKSWWNTRPWWLLGVFVGGPNELESNRFFNACPTKKKVSSFFFPAKKKNWKLEASESFFWVRRVTMNRIDITCCIYTYSIVCNTAYSYDYIHISSTCLRYEVLPTLSPRHIPTNFSITAPSAPFLCLNMPCPFVFLHLVPAHLRIHLNLIIHCLCYISHYKFVSIFSSWYFCHNSSTLSVLFPAHCSLWARHNLQVALSRLSISNPLCPLHLQHCFFSTSFTTISPHAIPCFLVCKCFHTSWSNCFGSSEKYCCQWLWLVHFVHICDDVSHFSPPKTAITTYHNHIVQQNNPLPLRKLNQD